MANTYTNYVRIQGCEASIQYLSNILFEPEIWIPIPSGLNGSALNTWKLSNWGCTNVFMNDSSSMVFLVNEDRSLEIEFSSNGGAPIAFYNFLASNFPDCLIEYEYFEQTGDSAGYGMANKGSEPYHFEIDGPDSLQEAKNAKIWVLNRYFI